MVLKRHLLRKILTLNSQLSFTVGTQGQKSPKKKEKSNSNHNLAFFNNNIRYNHSRSQASEELQ